MTGGWIVGLCVHNVTGMSCDLSETRTTTGGWGVGWDGVGWADFGE